jgi:hypothetical protein
MYEESKKTTGQSQVVPDAVAPHPVFSSAYGVTTSRIELLAPPGMAV